MLAVKLLGQFDVRRDGTPLVIPSRPAQSLFAFLLLNAGIPHRREKLAGLLWPETSEENARRSLRRELWRLRKAIEPNPSSDGALAYLQSDDITITFDAHSEYWLDAAVLEGANGESASADDLMRVVSLYHGELLPGFYDEWVALERERLRAVYEEKMGRLLECLQGGQRWGEAREWAERWIGFGGSPEPAYRALMVAHAEAGDMSQVAAVYQRCVEALREDVGVEPSEQTRLLFERLKGGPQGNRDAGEQVQAFSRALLADESPAPGEPPYKGLQYFEEADADLFFGRQRLIAQLVARLSSAPSTTGDMLVVIGASGSGKSSLVRAGLVPTFKRAGWQIHLITPTAHPLQALAVSLTRDAESITATTTLMDDLTRDVRTLQLYAHKLVKDRNRLLLVVDQFEELFTLCRNQAERKEFVDNLLTATSPDRGGPMTIVITLRADFYAHCSQYAGLREAVAKSQEYIGPMTMEELRQAIEGPAERGGWAFEPGLVDLILHDLGDEPGALPLLSHALLETWERRQARKLTLKGYADCGGVRGAIAQTADSVYGQLVPEQQAMARRILLQLTELGEGTRDTRRRVTIGELVSHSPDASAIEDVLRLLADARLITIGEGTVQVAHEALIREWHTLREWLTEDRDGLRLHRHVTEAAQAWSKLNRDEGELYRGARLAQTLEWARSNAGELNPLEREFLEASEQSQARQEAEREAQRQRELSAAKRLAEAERRRAQVERGRAEEQVRASHKLRQRAIFLAGALLVAAFLAVAAIVLAQQSNQNAQRTEDERRLAFARELSVNAVNNLEIDPERSILLALHAISVSDAGGKPVLREAEEALHRAVMASRVQLTLRGHTSGVNGIAYSPDGKRLVTGSNDNTAKIWDAGAGRELLTLSGHTDAVMGVAYSPDGTRVATASLDKTAKIWDAATGRELLTLIGHTGQVWRVAFSPDGRRIATAGADKTAKIWDAESGQELLTLQGHTDLIRVLVFSPDGTRLYTGSYDKTAKEWDAATGKPLVTFAGHTSAVWGLAISPDGTRLATSGFEQTAKIWDTASGRQLTGFSLDGSGNAVAFNRAGTWLATCTGAGTATLWDTATWQQVLVLRGHTAALGVCAFSPDPEGTHLATASGDSTARVWDIAPGGARDWLTFAGHGGRIHDIAYSPDGKSIATASEDKTAKVWDATTGAELVTLVGHTDWVRSVAFSPDGRFLATTSNDSTARVWDLSSGKTLLTLPVGPDVQGSKNHSIAFSPNGRRLAIAENGNTVQVWDALSGDKLLTLSGHIDLVHTVAFSRDGRRIATASADRTAKMWDAATGQELVTLSGHASQPYDVAFSPDGARIITGSGDGTAKIWDAATGQVLRTLSGQNGVVLGVAFSPDGTLAATAGAVGSDVTVTVWNVSPGALPGEQPLTLYGATARIFGVAFSPDGKRLASASTDGLARVYALPLEDIVTIAKSRLTRTWTVDECQKFLHVEQCPADPRIGSDVVTPMKR